MKPVEKLRQLCTALRSAHAQWSRSESIQYVTESVERASREVFDYVDSVGDWGEDLETKRLVLACDRYRAEWDKWAEMDSDQLRKAKAETGTRTMWLALGPNGKDGICDVMDTPFVFTPTEDPASLEKLPGMSYQQIAKILDWYLPGTKTPDVAKVAEDLNHFARHKEWKHYQPGYVAESGREKQRDVEEAWQARQGTSAQRQAVREAMNRVAPETIASLLLLEGPTPSIKQILKILPHVTEEEIRAEAKRLGVKVPMTQNPGSVDLPRNMVEHQRQQAEEHEADVEAQYSAPDGETLEEAIARLDGENLTCKQIAKRLSPAHGPQSAQNVGRLLAKIREEQHA